MLLQGITLLAAPTYRSMAYIQTLVANNLYPDFVILLGEHKESECNFKSQKIWQNIIIPDIEETILTTCKKANISYKVFNVDNINSIQIQSMLKETMPEVVIYSGFPGQIVSEELLNIGPKFLHMHSGWLPDYRGSTTIYYALLNKEEPAVTALILDKDIDTGPIIAKRHYPVPDSNMNIDAVYDSAIRADLLVYVLQKYLSEGGFTKITNNNYLGNTYYVIHPVLKHIAIMSLQDKVVYDK